MAMEMRLFRDLRPRTRYQKLLRDVEFDEEKSGCYAMKTPTRKRCFWVKKLNGKLIRGLKISKSKKRFSWFLYPRKIARIYSEVVKRLIELDGSNIIFSTTWGLPVLSHSTSARRSLSYV